MEAEDIVMLVFAVLFFALSIYGLKVYGKNQAEQKKNNNE